MQNKTKILSMVSVAILFCTIIGLYSIQGVFAFGLFGLGNFGNFGNLGNWGMYNQHDLNNDGIVNQDDMNLVLNLLNVKHDENTDSDFNNDGVVDNKDINILLSAMASVGYSNNINGVEQGISGLNIDATGNNNLNNGLNSIANINPVTPNIITPTVTPNTAGENSVPIINFAGSNNADETNPDNDLNINLGSLGTYNYPNFYYFPYAAINPETVVGSNPASEVSVDLSNGLSVTGSSLIRL
ncbi:Uncharacterised protein [uncultured archaeon]|nr:Uncharacterised protein [uncultured archaeon]